MYVERVDYQDISGISSVLFLKFFKQKWDLKGAEKLRALCHCEPFWQVRSEILCSMGTVATSEHPASGRNFLIQ